MISREPGPAPRGRSRRRLGPFAAVVAGASCGAATAFAVVAADGRDGNATPVARTVRQQPEATGRPPAPADTAGLGRVVPAPARPSARPDRRCHVDRLLVPSCGAWWGAAVNTWPQGPALRAFERKIGRPVGVYHTYYRGRKIFPSAGDIALAREPGRRRLLLLNWKPDAPGTTWRQVADGAVDDHIDRLSKHFREKFPERFWLAIHHEPEEEVRETPGSGYTAADYRAMFRHVVQRFRRNGVDNAVFTMVYMGYSGYVVKPWFRTLYPGDDVVDWIGFDPYAEPRVRSFAQLVDEAAPRERDLGIAGFYRWSRRNLSDDKPLMLSEWGGTEMTGDPAKKAELFRSIGRQIERFPALKALVYWEHHNGPKFGDTRVDASPQSLAAYRELGRRPYFNPPVPKR
ncbi:hypothetical protein [Actinomadura kijaniata]|uniref:hypothetical protein n=1 Tax=Actinomadura kijaniata TaxID=46161 RepID=UPI000832F15D|nr:hypothetical protein [Actinomadura kijaniata]